MVELLLAIAATAVLMIVVAVIALWVQRLGEQGQLERAQRQASRLQQVQQ